MVRIGTPVFELIKAAGGMPENTGKIISGGPMMGKALKLTDIPVVKGTSGVVLFTENESKRPEPFNCIRCGKCVSVCPMGLEPYLLLILSEKKLIERAEKNNIMDCIECGSCTYICPSNRPIIENIRFGKVSVTRLQKTKQQ